MNNIHLNHEKKFLLHDPRNIMTIPEPIPIVEEFSKREETTFSRYPFYNKIAPEIANNHVSKKPKQFKCERQILEKGIEIIGKYRLFGNLTET